MIEDGFCITYIKDGMMYPVGVTKEQNKFIQIMVPSLVVENPGDKVKVFLDNPICAVTNLAEKRREINEDVLDIY